MALSSLCGRDALPEVNTPPVGQKPPQEVLIQPPPTVAAGPGLLLPATADPTSTANGGGSLAPQPLLRVSMMIGVTSAFLPAPFFITYRAAFYPPEGAPLGAIASSSGAGEALRSLDAPLGIATGIGQAQPLAAAAEPAPPSCGPATSCRPCLF